MPAASVNQIAVCGDGKGLRGAAPSVVIPFVPVERRTTRMQALALCRWLARGLG